MGTFVLVVLVGFGALGLYLLGASLLGRLLRRIARRYPPPDL